MDTAGVIDHEPKNRRERQIAPDVFNRLHEVSGRPLRAEKHDQQADPADAVALGAWQNAPLRL